MNYTIYFVDTETTGLNESVHDIIELSLYRLNDDIQKTWCLAPFDTSSIEVGALRVNGHKIEDLKHETKFGREMYKNPNKTIVEIENWIMEDSTPTENRILVAHNVRFDYSMLKKLWEKSGSSDSFPFGRRTMDTMAIEIFLDFCRGSMDEGYSLFNLTKKYGLKNEKSHTAAADCLVLKQIFDKQSALFKKAIGK